MYKRMIAIALALVMLFSTTAFATKTSEAAFDLTAAEIASMAQASAIGAYQELRTTFTLVNNEIVSYPDGYGGAYINEDNKLVIKIVEGYSAYQTQVEAVLSANRPVRFVNCQYSLNNLFEYQEAAEEYSQYLVSSYISQENSVVKLFVFEENKETLEAALIHPTKRSVDVTAPYEIIPTESALSTNTADLGCSNEESSVYAGSQVYGGDPVYKSNGITVDGSLCIGGTYGSYSKCILTAAHVLQNNNDNLNLAYSIPLTKRYSSASGNYSNGDYAICSYSAIGVNNSNKVNLTSTSTGTVNYYYELSDLPERVFIYKYGSSTGMSVGIVSGTGGTSYSPDGLTICNVIPVTYRSDWSPQNFIARGDSGGAVWCVDGSGNRILLGVVSGMESDTAENSSVYYYTPISYAVNAGFTPCGMTGVGEIEEDDSYQKNQTALDRIPDSVGMCLLPVGSSRVGFEAENSGLCACIL